MILINLDSKLQIQLTKQQCDLILNQLINFKNEKNRLYNCYKEICDRLKNELDKNRQLSKILEHKEQIQKQTDKIKKELEERICRIENELNNQLKLNNKLKFDKIEQSKLFINSYINNVSGSIIDNLDENLNDNLEENLRCSTNQQSTSFNKSNLIQQLSISFNNQLNLNQQSTQFNNQANLIQQSINKDLNQKSINNNLNQQTIDENLNNQFDNSSKFTDHHKLVESNLRLGFYIDKYIKINQNLNNQLDKTKKLNLNLNKKIIDFKNQINDYKLNLDKLFRESKILNEIINEKNIKLNKLSKLRSEFDNRNNKSIEYLIIKLNEKEFQIKELNDQLKSTELKLDNKQNENCRLLNELDIIKLNNNQLENDYHQLKQSNKQLNDERSKLLDEIEDLQNEYADIDNGQCCLKEIFETVLKDKDDEIDNLNCSLNEINTKLRECLPTSEFKQNNLILLDELISNYRKFSTPNQHNNIQSYQQKDKFNNESYSSLTPLESLDDNEFES